MFEDAGSRSSRIRGDGVLDPSVPGRMLQAGRTTFQMNNGNSVEMIVNVD